MGLVDFNKNITSGINAAKTALNLTQNKEPNLFSAAKSDPKAEFNNFFKGVEFLVENEITPQAPEFKNGLLVIDESEDTLLLDINEPTLDIDDTFLSMPDFSSDKTSKLDGFFA